MVILLDGVGGYVDAVGFLLLSQLFAANMSGNSILLGIALGQGQWQTALRQGLPIPLFVGGVALAVLLERVVLRRGMRPAATILGAEVVLLAAFALYGSSVGQSGSLSAVAPWQTVVLTALITLPMGLQNGAVRRAAGLAVRTTFVTGTLTSMAESLVRSLDRNGQRGPDPPRATASSAEQAWLLGTMWAAYVAGAALGAYATTRWALGALGVPLLCLVALAVLDLARPPAPPNV